MKNICAFLLAIAVSLLTTVTSYSAGPVAPENSGLNSIAVAMKLAEGIESYRIFVYYDMGADWHHMDIVMSARNKRVTQLSVDDVPVLEEGESLPGIPFPKSGAFIQATIYLSAVSVDGNEVAYGSNFYPYLYPGENFSVLMHPVGDSFLLDLPGQPGDVLFIDGAHAGYYDPSSGRFVCWAPLVDSLREHEYQVYRNGQLVGAGQLDNFFRKVEQTSQKFGFVSTFFDGNVVMLGPSAPNQIEFQLDSDLALPGQQFASTGKVFVLDGKGGMSFYVQGEYDVAVLYVIGDDNNLYEVTRQAQDAQQWTPYFPSETPDGRQLILVVYGPKGNTIRVYVDFWRDAQWPRGG